MPIWIQDGVTYAESLSILRLVGRQYGYYPPEYHDMWAADSIVDWINDYTAKIVGLVAFEKRLDESGEKDFC